VWRASTHELAYDETHSTEEILRELVDMLRKPVSALELFVMIEHKRFHGDGESDTKVLNYTRREIDEGALRLDFRLAAPSRGSFVVRHSPHHGD